MAISGAGSKLKVYGAGAKIRRVVHAGRTLYSAGNTVTYVAGSGTSYREDVDEGKSCLSPQTFVPAKPGHTFIGWSLTDGGAVLQSFVMADSPVTLYARFIPSSVSVGLYDSDYVTYSGFKTDDHSAPPSMLSTGEWYKTDPEYWPDASASGYVYLTYGLYRRARISYRIHLLGLDGSSYGRIGPVSYGSDGDYYGTFDTADSSIYCATSVSRAYRRSAYVYVTGITFYAD